MKTNEEILNDVFQRQDKATEIEAIIEAMTELEQQTRGEMFEFIKWMFFGSHPFIQWYDELGWFFTDEINDKRWTVEELFEYWKTNVKGK